MKILTTSNGVIITSAHNFAFGAWEEADKRNGVITHKWKVEDENGNTTLYIIDENLKAIDGTEEPMFKVYEVDEIPEGVEQGKYLFVDGAFVENPDYVEPPKSDEERIAELENEVGVLQEENIASSEMEAELLYELSLMQLGIIE